MKILYSKKGYTLVELLAVLAVLTIIASLTFSIFSELSKISNNRVDQSRITIYNRAFEDFRFTDYSTLQATPDEQVVIVEGGKVKIHQYLNLNGEDIEALSNSGKGRYPQTHRECVAVIRAYCGTNDILPMPAAGVSYSYFYNVSEGKCFVKPVTDIDPSDTDWINLNEYYTLITDYRLGDANNDGAITRDDVDTIMNCINNNYFPSYYIRWCCDINGDKLVTIHDATELERIINENQIDTLKWK